MNATKHAKRSLAVAAWVMGAGLAYGGDPTPKVETASTEAPTVAVCNDCAKQNRIRLYGSLDYLIYNFRDMPAPPLIQHVPTNLLTNPLDPNAAQTLFGNGIDHNGFNGVYGSAGVWLSDCWAIEGSYAQFEVKDKRYFIDSPGDPSIGRYYFDVTNATNPNTYLIYSQPDGSVSGWINAASPVEFWHADVNLRTRGVAVFCDRVDWLFGFRYADLRDAIYVQDFTIFNANGLSYLGEDNFDASNQFYGGQIGANSFTQLGYGFNLEVTGKLAVGGVRQRALISGQVIEQRNGVVTQVYPGDVLTQTTNIGEYERTQFAVLPELIVKLGYAVTDRLSVTVGYNFLAISSVVRAGSVIDEGINPNVNPLLIPASQSTAQRPAFDFGGTEFWAQGLMLGVSLRY